MPSLFASRHTSCASYRQSWPASGEHTPAVSRERFRPEGKPLFIVDEFAAVAEERDEYILRLRGWAVDPSTAQSAAGILVEVAGRESWLTGGGMRPDVAAHFGVPEYMNSGFNGIVLLGRLPPGRHQVAFRVVSHDGQGFYDDGQRREVVVR